ncbi:MAG: DNA-processing protein DprA [Bacteroidota bacterium]
MEQEQIYKLALHLIPGVGYLNFKQLISYFGEAEAVFSATKGKLIKVPGIGNTIASHITSGHSLAHAEIELKKVAKFGGEILFHSDEHFPKRLKLINDAPALLYHKGNTELNKQKTIAIVGTRKATDYGKAVTKELIKELTKYDPLIISGLAFGIDIQAHKGALENGLQTVGVMAGGLNVIYPREHGKTAMKMIDSGGLLTENKIDAKPDAPKFPARNRIIAGMADITIVVEAARKGGALITAEIANGYNRDVFAVPGNIREKMSEGCNHLIRSNKAHLLTSVEDIEYIMRWDSEGQVSKKEKETLDLSLFDNEEIKVLQCLKACDSPLMIDKLSWQTNINVSQLSSILLNLEFKGYVSSLPGKMFRLAS